MALNNLGLGFVFTARDRATGTIRKVGNAFDQTTTRMRLSSGLLQGALVGLGASVAVFAAGAGALRAAFGAADTAAEFGQTIARIGAVTRATTGELQQLRDAAIQAGLLTQFSPQEAAQGLLDLGTLGFTAAESIAALGGREGQGGVLDLATGGMISVSDAAISVGSALRVFGLEADQAGYVTDRLLRISNATALQASDLAISMGNISRGASQARQSIEEMLPAIGLVKNTGVDASVAASAVSSALQFMARNAADFRDELGVSVTDAQGNFRPFLDIVRETSEALGQVDNQAERVAIAQQLFGRFGVSAFAAIEQQITSGIRTSEGEIVRGAEAIEYLREQMRTADGAAAEFRDQLLDTFAGQRQLLTGVVQTIETVAGEAFGKVFRPIVEGLVTLLTFLTTAFNAMPAEARTAIAGLVTAIAALTAGFGAAATAGFAIAIMLPFLKVIAITLGIVALVFAPVIAGAVGLAVAVGALGVAIDRNIGGIGDFFREQFGRVRLAFDALRQLFTDGFFSGAVMEEMQRAENGGIRQFVITIFRIGSRILEFFGGIRDGFNAGVEAMAPAVTALRNAIVELGNALGFVQDGADGLANTNMQSWAQQGARIGRFFASVIEHVIDVIRHAVQFSTGFAQGFQLWLPVLRVAFGALGNVLRETGEAFGEMFGWSAQMVEEGREGGGQMSQLGRVFAKNIVPAIGAAAVGFAFIVSVVRDVVRAINFFVNMHRTGIGLVRGFVAGLVASWQNLGDEVSVVFNGIVAEALSMVRRLPEPVRNLAGLGGETGQALAQREQAALTAQRTARARIGLRTATAARIAAEALPATEETRARAAAARDAQTINAQALARELRQQPVQVRTAVVLDGQVVAESVERARRSGGAAGFNAARTANFAEE